MRIHPPLPSGASSRTWVLKQEVKLMPKNRIEVEGYLASQPVRRYLASGTPVSNVRLGETYSYKDAQGNTLKQTNWHSLSFYGNLADIALTYSKGERLFVEGSIEQRKFTPARDGVQRTVHEIIVRNCHLVAPRRSTPANGAEPNKASEAG
jgi:single-strand DNA-binding protein